MAVTNLGRVPGTSISVTREKIEGAQSSRQVQDYTQVYMLQLDDPCDDEYDIGSAAGLPVVGSFHPDLPAFKCVSRDFQETESPDIWTCTVTYSTKREDNTSKSPSPGQSKDGTENPGPEQQVELDPDPKPTQDTVEDPDAPPWEQPAKVNVSTSYVTRKVENAYFLGRDSTGATGVPTSGGKVGAWVGGGFNDANGYKITNITNSAGNETSFDASFPAFNIQIEYAAVASKSWLAYPDMLGQLNQTAFTLKDPLIMYIAPLSMKYLELNVSNEIWDDGTQYVIIQQTFEVINHTGGHRIPLADVGPNYYDTANASGSGLPGRGQFNTNAQAKWARDIDDQPMQTWLNGYGGQTNQEAATLWWCPWYTVEGMNHLFTNAGLRVTT